MFDIARSFRSVATVAALCLATLAGCSRSVRAPQAADADKARQDLVEALDAWKKGESPDALANRGEPIRFTDWEYRSGRKLLAYESTAELLTGPRRDFTIRLTVGGRGGKPVAETVIYEVETDPSTSIVRRDGR